MKAAVCPHCLTTLANQGSVCPKCGGQTDFSSPVHCIPIGTTVNSSSGHSFIIGKVIGDGGFGITYVAKELSSGRIVAIKEYYPKNCIPRRQGMTIYPSTSQDAFNHGLQSFLKEATMLRAVASIPSIVHVLDYFEANNTAYVVMEYLNGRTLRRVVEHGGAMSFRDLLPKLKVFMNDIATLHDAGVLHRDIAPDNVMLMPDGSLKLLDFGCARSMEDGRAMTVILKPGFAPVEQYQTRGQGPCTDIYALCATIYYCVTGGKVPPGSPERQIAIAGNQPDPLVHPIALGANMCPANEQVLLWGLSVRPENRPQKVSELASRFVNEPSVPQSVPQPSPVSVTPQPQPQPQPAPYPNHPQPQPIPQPAVAQKNNTWKLVVGIIAAVVVVIILAVSATFFALREKEANTDYTPRTPSQNDTSNENKDGENDNLDVVVTNGEDDDAAVPAVNTFSDDYGIEYLINGDELTVVGCSDNDSIIYIPSTVDIPGSEDSYYVTSIASGAFKDNSTMQSVHLPLYLETIEDGAFDNCSDLRCVEFYSALTTGSSPFKNCNKLRCALYFEIDYPNGFNCPLPKGVSIYPILSEFTMTMLDESLTDKLLSAYVDDNGVIYAIPYDSDFALLLEVPSGLKELVVPDTVPYYSEDYEVIWAYDSAFDNADSDFELVLSEQFYMNPWVYSKVNYCISANAPISDSLLWAINMEIVEGINSNRASGLPMMQLNDDLSIATMVRANEIADDPDLYLTFLRPDGSNWTAAVLETDYSGSQGTEIELVCSNMSSSTVKDIVDDLVIGLDDEYDDGSYTTNLAVACAKSDVDGNYYIIGICANE